MADEQIVTNIVANADFSNLIADVHKVTASLSQLQEKIGLSNKTLANQIAVMNRSFFRYNQKHWSIFNSFRQPNIRCRKIWPQLRYWKTKA